MSPISVYRHGKNVKFTTKIMIDEEEKTSWQLKDASVVES
jgi:hypothetical protein